MPRYQHLYDTLEVRAYLQQFKAEKRLFEPILGLLERFLARAINGRFVLRDKEGFGKHEDEIRRTLASVSMTEPERVEVSTLSLTELIASESPDRQMLIYALADSGSVAEVLASTPRHKEVLKGMPPAPLEYQGEMRDIGLERRLRSCFNAAGLTDNLLETGYGVSFGKIFERGIVSYFLHLFAHAAAGHVGQVEEMMPLAGIFRSNMPVGRYPQDPERPGVERWLVFIE